MKDQLQTIRAALEWADNGYTEGSPINVAIMEALTALDAIEADHFTSADMASAAASGFRDGVASVTAGQKPVKWMCTETKVLYEHDTSEVDKYHGFKPTVPLYAAPVAQPQEPFGTVTVVRRQGCVDTYHFYRHPEPPYLDNAAEYHTVYTAAPVAQQPKRCELCNYQHGHQIGCENNPVDIALGERAAQQPQAEAVPLLSVEQIQALYDECDKKSDGGNEFMLMFARLIEQAVRAKMGVPPQHDCDCGRTWKHTAYGWAATEPAQAVPASCGECGKKTSDGWALYCVACMEKAGLLGGTSSPPLTHPCTSSLVRTADSTAQAAPLLSDAEIAALMPPPDIDGSKARSPNAVRLAMRAAEQAVRAKPKMAVPMPGDQIFRIARRLAPKVIDGMVYVPEWIVPLVRAVEEAHGIVGKEGA